MNTSWDGKLGLRDLEALLIRGFCGKFCSARCARTHIWSMDTFDMYIMCVLCIQPRQQASLSNHISVLRICSWLLSSRMLRLSHNGGQESPQLVLLRRWIGSFPYALSFFFLKLFANDNKKQSRSWMIASKQRWFCTIILFSLIWTQMSCKLELGLALNALLKLVRDNADDLCFNYWWKLVHVLQNWFATNFKTQFAGGSIILMSLEWNKHLSPGLTKHVWLKVSSEVEAGRFLHCGL